MRSIFKYIFISCAALAAACSDSFDDESTYGSDTEGGVAIAITTKAADDSDSTTLDELLETTSTLKIYNSDGDLIRRYSPATECPETMYLVIGDYSYTLSLGSMESPTLDGDNLSYYAEGVFTIASQATSELDVECDMLNAKFSVEFDDSDLGLKDNLEEGYSVTFVVGDSVSDEMLEDSYSDKLKFTESGSGYFIIPDGCSDVAWRFEGTRIDGETVSMSGVLEDVESATSNTLTFSYDKYLGLGSVKVTVDTSTEDKEDIFGFLPQPKVAASGFTIGETQPTNGVDTDYSFNISSVYKMDRVEITVGDSVVTAAVESEYATYSVTDDLTWSVTLKAEIFKLIGEGGEQSVTVTAYDVNNSAGSATMSVNATGITGISGEDFWANTGVISASVYEDASVIKIEYREYIDCNGDGVIDADDDNHTNADWGSYTASGSGNIYTATTTADWGSAKKNAYGLEYYTLNRGVSPNNNYRCRLVVDGETRPAVTVTSKDQSQTITNGSFDSKDLSCFGTDNEDTTTWGSGNNTFVSGLCSYSSGKALLSTKDASGNLAAGNLFYGQFTFNGIFAQTGTVGFGQKFTWTTRPRTLKLNYSATVGGDMTSSHKDDLGVTHTQDRARIYMAIVAWSGRHEVISGSGDPSGVWDPEGMTSVDKGNIIAYASYFIDESTDSSMQELEIPIYYYDTNTNPSSSAISLVISCASSAYGDYMTGSTSSRLYVDDFEFGY